MRLSLLLCSMAGAGLSTGCAGKLPPRAPLLILPVAESLRAPCPRPVRPAAPSVGELAGFSIEQEAAISGCEALKEAAVQTIDAHNRLAAALAAGPKRRWWRGWR